MKRTIPSEKEDLKDGEKELAVFHNFEVLLRVLQTTGSIQSTPEKAGFPFPDEEWKATTLFEFYKSEDEETTVAFVEGSS